MKFSRLFFATLCALTLCALLIRRSSPPRFRATPIPGTGDGSGLVAIREVK